MNDLSQLREVSDRVLHDLTADESLKHRILQRAAGCEDFGRQRVFRPLPVFCGVIAVLLGAAIALNGVSPVQPSESVEMNVFAAGYKETVAPSDNDSQESSPIPEGMNPESVVKIELQGVGTINDPAQCSSLIRMLMEESRPVEAVNHSSLSDLIISFSDGESIVFGTDHSSGLFGESNWSCPGFFTAFRQLLAK